MNEKKIVAILYIVCVYLEVATSLQNIYNVTYYSKYYIGIGITVVFALLYVYRYRTKFPLNRNLLFLAKLFVIPMLGAYVYTLILDVVHPVEFSGFFTRALGLLVYSLIAIAQAYFTYAVLKEKAVDYTFVAVSLNYLTSMIVAFRQDGTKQFISLLTDTSYNGSVLEMHEVAPIVAMFVFYFWYQFRFNNCSFRVTIIKEIVCFAIIFFSMKRIVFLSCFITLVIFEFIRYFYKRRKINMNLPPRVIVRLLGWLMLAAMFGFVFFVKSGLLYTFLDLFRINSMARAEFWTAISGQYEFSPLYFGRGLGYVSKWMDNNWMNLGIAGLTQSIGIHSDILKYYIDLGFWGFFFFFYFYLIGITKRIDRKIGFSASVMYFLLMVLQFLIYFTDNISIYHNYQWIMYLMIYSLIAEKTGRIQKSGEKCRIKL